LSPAIQALLWRKLWHGAQGRAGHDISEDFQKKNIRFVPIETPDIIVVLDHLLLAEADVTRGLNPAESSFEHA